MGRILVFFHSNTNCTQQMAEYVAQGAMSLPGHEVRIRSCADCLPSDVLWADGLAVGTPTNLGGIAWEMKKWWDEFATGHWDKVDGKLCTTFSSQGGHGGGAELSCMAMATVLLNFGFLFFGVTDYVDPLHTLHYGAVVAKCPRKETDIAACRRLGLRLAEWVSVYADGNKAMHPLLTTKAQDRALAPAVRGRPVHLVIQKAVPVENQAKWLDAAAELSRYSWREDGCISYQFFRGDDSDTTFYIVETWASQAHLDQHSASAHFQKLVPAMDAMSETVRFDKCANAIRVRRSPPSGTINAPVAKKVLVFTKATDYVHASLPAAAACIHLMCAKMGWTAVVSDDESLLEKPSEEMFDVIVFVNNSGNLFDTSKEVLSDHLAAGRGILGIHAALASFLVGEDPTGTQEMEYSSPVFESIFGAHFKNHPAPQEGRVSVHEDNVSRLGISFGSLPASFDHEDEFFNLSRNPADDPDITVLASVDERTYEGGTMGQRHPVVWTRTVGNNQGRVFYTALGHFSHFYNGRGPSTVAKIIEGGLRYVAKGL